MQIEYLEEFVVAAQSLNFTSAAREIGISQPKMSTHMADLERELGFRLFNRNDSGLSLTHEGKIYFEELSVMVESYKALVKRCLRESKEHIAGSLVFGKFQQFESFPTVATDLLLEGINRLVDSDPAPDITLKTMVDSLSVTEQLKKGYFDCSMRTCCLEEAPDEIVDLDDGTSVLPLAETEIREWVPIDSAEAKKEQIDIHELSGSTILLSSSRSLDTWNSTLRDVLASAGVAACFKMIISSNPVLIGWGRERKDSEVMLISKGVAASKEAQFLKNWTSVPLTGLNNRAYLCLVFQTYTSNSMVMNLVEAIQDVGDESR